MYLFSGDLTDVDRIARCPVAIEAEGALKEALPALAGAARLAIRCRFPQAARCCTVRLRTTRRASPHAIWLRTEDALRALLRMMAGTHENARNRGLANTLAGPVLRGVPGVVEKQLSLMEGLREDLPALLGLMSRRAVALVRQRLTPRATLDAIAAAVEQSLERALTGAAKGASAE
jgi:predicted short-subunit dehydrogenase-like oxidoreductase (DUF2520 family)